MGKIKRKPRRQKEGNDNPLGLEKNIQEERENPVITNLLDKLTHSDEELRKCACTGIANLVTQPGTLVSFLKKDVVRVLGPLLLDESLTVQKEALGTLRNISVSGGETAGVCETMVAQDVMTPVVSLMQKYISASQEESFQHSTGNIQILTEAAHLLWNLCESSEVAVKIFNQQLLHVVLMPVLKPSTFPQTLVLPVVQCLNTVSEDNSVLCGQLSNELVSLVNLLDWPQTCHSDLLISMNIVGLLQNVIAFTECDVQMYNHILERSAALFEKVLQIDLVPILQKAIEACKEAKSEDIMSPQSSETLEEMENKDSEQRSANGEQEETDMVDESGSEEIKPKEKHSSWHRDESKAERVIDDVHDLVKAQILAATLISNMCCSQDDDSWEDVCSSDGSIEDVSMETESDAKQTDDGLSAGTLQLFITHRLPQCIMSKCQPVDQTVMIQMASDRDTHALLKSVRQVQVCSLVCLSNLLTNQNSDSSGLALNGSDNIQFLQSAWQLLGPLLSACRKTDTELLEAETLALRAVLERLAKADVSLLQQAGERDLHFLCELTQQCANDNSRANLIRVVACIGCALAKQPQPHHHLKGIGEFFCTVCSTEPEVWVIAECLDCVFDVFGEDHLNPLLKEIGLIGKLQQIAPVLKAKVREQQGRLGEHEVIVSTARTNLTRFIKYKLPLVT